MARGSLALRAGREVQVRGVIAIVEEALVLERAALAPEDHQDPSRWMDLQHRMASDIHDPDVLFPVDPDRMGGSDQAFEKAPQEAALPAELDQRVWAAVKHVHVLLPVNRDSGGLPG